MNFIHIVVIMKQLTILIIIKVGYKHNTVFDELLYKVCFIIEQTNTRLNAYKAILVRFETNDLHWQGLLLLDFSII